MLLLLVLSTSARITNAKPIPSISNQFFLKTTEIDDTNNNSVSVHQTIIVDPIEQRSHMTADGPLSGGHLEEITRCDVGWKTGYALTLGGKPGTNVTEWQCTNRTLNPAPSSCQWSNFWSFPMNSTYQGIEDINLHNGTKIKCDEWKYWDSGEEYSFHTLIDTAIPVRTAKIFTSIPSYHLWHIDFTDFSGGFSAPVSDFNPPRGIKCIPPPPALPGLVDLPDKNVPWREASAASLHTLSTLVSTVSNRYRSTNETKTIQAGTTNTSCCTTYPCSKYQVVKFENTKWASYAWYIETSVQFYPPESWIPVDGDTFLVSVTCINECKFNKKSYPSGTIIANKYGNLTTGSMGTKSFCVYPKIGEGFCHNEIKLTQSQIPIGNQVPLLVTFTFTSKVLGESCVSQQYIYPSDSSSVIKMKVK